MVRVLSTIVAVLVIALFPPAALAFVSQNAIPGDSTYPIKRKLEDGILLVLSVKPSWKVEFTTTQSDRRLVESEALISQGKDASSTLEDLVSTTDAAAVDINSVSPTEQVQLKQNLVNNINDYEVKLTAAEQEAAKVTANVPLQTPTPVQSTSPVQNNNQTQAVTGETTIPASPPSSTQLDQIQQTKQQLDDIKLKIQANDSNRENMRPSPTSTPRPSQTSRPSTTPQPLPSDNTHNVGLICSSDADCHDGQYCFVPPAPSCGPDQLCPRSRQAAYCKDK